MNSLGRGASSLLLVLVLLSAFALPGCGSPASGETVVTVLGPWTGAEKDGFKAMLQSFENSYGNRHGIRFAYTGTRDADAVLTSDLNNGKPPDLAVLATRGELNQFAAMGKVQPLDRVLGLTRMTRQYNPGWRGLMQAAGPSRHRHYYAIIVKATLKSLIWYDPAKFPPGDLRLLKSRHLTWSQLISLTHHLGTSPWCMGMADVSRSGWPGTDWIEDIVLHRYGPKVYDQWIAGALPWSSPQIRQAWQTFGQVAAAAGTVAHRTKSELVTSYGQAGLPMFKSPPRCYLDHEGSFITGFYPRSADFNFIQFPPLTPAGKNVEEVSADLLAMFHKTPAASKLIAYLTTRSAQEAWISRRPGSGALSVNRQVPRNAYPDTISGRLAQILTTATSPVFDASNSMQQTMENAFDNAVLQYLECPAQLNDILYGLDLVHEHYPSAGQQAAAAPVPTPAPAPASSCVTRSKPTRHRHKRFPK